MYTLIISILATLIITTYIFRPLFLDITENKLEEFEDKKQVKLDELAELETDFLGGKIDKSDYLKNRSDILSYLKDIN